MGRATLTGPCSPYDRTTEERECRFDVILFARTTTNWAWAKRVLRTTRNKQDRRPLSTICVCCGEAAKRADKTKEGRGEEGEEEGATTRLSRGYERVEQTNNGWI